MGARESVPWLLAVQFNISIVETIGFEPWQASGFLPVLWFSANARSIVFGLLRFFTSRNLQALLRQGKDDSVLVVRKGRKDAREE